MHCTTTFAFSWKKYTLFQIYQFSLCWIPNTWLIVPSSSISSMLNEWSVSDAGSGAVQWKRIFSVKTWRNISTSWWVAICWKLNRVAIMLKSIACQCGLPASVASSIDFFSCQMFPLLCKLISKRGAKSPRRKVLQRLFRRSNRCRPPTMWPDRMSSSLMEGVKTRGPF